jgi:HK97 family phage major capsid protein
LGSGSSASELVVGTAGAGGNAVATNLRPQDFIELMRARMLSAELGVRRLTGLVGNVDVTRQTGAATAYWVGENTAATESQQTIGLMQLRPRGLAAYTQVGRLLRTQMTPDADMFVMDDLAKQCALALDKAVFAGTGSGDNQPTGIMATAGIGSVTGTSMDWAKVLEFQTDVAAANALNRNCKYVTTPTVASLLSQRQRFASTDTPLWSGNILDGELGGFPAHTSTQLTAGTAIFGDFSEIVQAEWGILEIDVNPYANFAAGTIGVRAFHYVDIGVRTAGAFSAASSIT